jgi:hypothetical protein
VILGRGVDNELKATTPIGVVLFLLLTFLETSFGKPKKQKKPLTDVNGF